MAALDPHARRQPTHPANVSVADGTLVLAHRGSTEAGFTGAEAHTEPLYTEGEWTALVETPSASGTVCAFFLYGYDDGIVNEIDVELLAGQLYVGTYADWQESDGYDNSPTREVTVADVDTSGIHAYTIRWSPTSVDFAFDGADIASFTTAVPTGPIGLFFNHWTSTTWPEVQNPPAGDLDCRIHDVIGVPL